MQCDHKSVIQLPKPHGSMIFGPGGRISPEQHQTILDYKKMGYLKCPKCDQILNDTSKDATVST